MTSKSKPEGAEGAGGTMTLSDRIIGAAIEVHRHAGPGLLESADEECLRHELSQVGLTFKRQVYLPLTYKGIKSDCGYKMDLVVEDTVVVELKTVDQISPVHTAQLLTYLKLSGKKVGLMLNFNAPLLAKGIKRLVNHFEEPSSLFVSSAASALSGFEFNNSASPRLCGESRLVSQ
jgi:GxxExxY protein